MAFPRQRLRRLRQTENLRKMVRETTLSSDDFIYPLFAVHGKGIKKRFLPCRGIISSLLIIL